MIFLELTKSKKQQYRQLFPIIKTITDQLDRHDLLHICGGEFRDSPYVVYRDIYYIENKPVGFIDVYSFDENNMYIVLAVLDKYRNMGIASTLVRKMEQSIDVNSIKYLVWKTDKDNKGSQKLAMKLGYKLYRVTNTSRSYFKPNPAYKRTVK